MITNFVPDLLCFGQQHYICSQKVRIVTTKKLACNNIQNHALQANSFFLPTLAWVFYFCLKNISMGTPEKS